MATAPAHGGKEFNRALADLTDQFERYEVVPQELIDAGDDRVVQVPVDSHLRTCGVDSRPLPRSVLRAAQALLARTRLEPKDATS